MDESLSMSVYLIAPINQLSISKIVLYAITKFNPMSAAPVVTWIDAISMINVEITSN